MESKTELHLLRTLNVYLPLNSRIKPFAKAHINIYSQHVGATKRPEGKPRWTSSSSEQHDYFPSQTSRGFTDTHKKDTFSLRRIECSVTAWWVSPGRASYNPRDATEHKPCLYRLNTISTRDRMYVSCNWNRGKTVAQINLLERNLSLRASKF